MIYFDIPQAQQLTFGDMASPQGQYLHFFHDYIMTILVFILGLVGYILLSAIRMKRSHKYLIHGPLVEFIWTLVPAIILVFIAFPSLRLLYWIDEILDPQFTIKAIGHQWYWSYEYTDMESTSLLFDSYMIPSSDLNTGDFRLLEVDNPVVAPLFSPLRMVISGADVIHSWTIPALGVKADGIPGRINQMGMMVDRPGTYYGQCSEICGSEHSFMPITVKAIQLDKFLTWLSENSES